MKIQIKKSFKSLVANKEVDLPDFCVLTGKNGSGKSHFLESLTRNDVTSVLDKGKLISNADVRYILFNGLNPVIDVNCNRATLSQQINECVRFFNDVYPKLKQAGEIANNLWEFHSSPIYKRAILNVANKLNKSLSELDESDLRRHLEPSDLDGNEAFKGHFAKIFKSYQVKLEENEYFDFRNKKRGGQYKVFTDEEFVKLYGPKPWEVVNGILREAGIRYTVSNPEGDDRDSNFHFKLIDEQHKIEILPSELSTGEKVLMCLALAIYNSAKDNIKNKVLLIDEPDAALHPEFSKFLLTAIKKHIVDGAGVKVIITTHSPTTVAMAEEEWIYEMDKEEKIPKKVTKQKALSILTVDIPSLRVSIDKRRIVFVESGLDAVYYQKVFQILNPCMNLDIQPDFFAPHCNNGPNCSDVKYLMTKLANTDGVYGVIDYDNVNHSSGKVKVMGEGGESRYTKENYIFDPIFVGLVILRDGKEERPDDLTITKFITSSNDDKQKLIDWVENELNLNQGEILEYETMSNEKFKINSDWINHDGHGLEDKIVKKWRAFERLKDGFRNHGGDAVKAAMLNTVIRDNWQYLSKDFEILFKSLI